MQLSTIETFLLKKKQKMKVYIYTRHNPNMTLINILVFIGLLANCVFFFIYEKERIVFNNVKYINE